MSVPSLIHLATRNILGPKPNPNPVQNVIEHFSAIEGPWLIAAVIQAFLMGIIVVQAYDYFLLYKTDSKWLRGTMVFLLVANLVCCVADIYIVYYAFILNLRVFFAVRAFKVNRSIPIAVIMGTLILTSLGAWLAVAIESLIGGVGQAHLGKLLTSVQVASWSTAAADIFISAVFVKQMASSKKGFNSSTDSIVSRLLAMSVGTAGITAVVAIINALSFALNNSTSSAWIIPNFTIPRVYTISMLYVLNSRRSLRLVAEGGNTSTGGEERAGTKSKSRYGRSEGAGMTSGIAVNLETFVTHDVGGEEEEQKRGVRF